MTELTNGPEPAHSNDKLILSSIQIQQKDKNIMSNDYVQNMEYYAISREEKHILFRLYSLIRKSGSFMIEMDEFARDTIVHAEADEYSDDVANTCKLIFELILSKKNSNYQSNWFSELEAFDSGISFGEIAGGESYIAFPVYERNDAK